MKQAVLDRPGQARIVDIPDPVVRAPYVLVRVLVAPMCNEYWAFDRWYFQDRNAPGTLGHEAAGIVMTPSEDGSLTTGDRVVCLSGYPCLTCETCRLGSYAHCETPENPLHINSSQSGDACFSQYTLKRPELLVKIPDEISLEHASLLGCGLGGAFTALRRAEASSGDRVLITGLGPVGLGAVLLCTAMGIECVGVSNSEYRATLARELGASRTLSLLEAQEEFGHSPDGILRVAERWRPSVGLECSAQSGYQRLQLDAAAPLGRVMLLGESADLVVNVDRDITRRGISITGSLDLSLNDVNDLMQIVSTSGKAIDRLITHRFALDEIQEAFQLQSTRMCGKVLLHPFPGRVHA